MLEEREKLIEEREEETINCIQDSYAALEQLPDMSPEEP
jgi:hypothetical protein